MKTEDVAWPLPGQSSIELDKIWNVLTSPLPLLFLFLFLQTDRQRTKLSLPLSHLPGTITATRHRDHLITVAGIPE